MLPIITKKEAEKIISSKEKKLEISLDLGLSLTAVFIEEGFARIKENKVPLPEFAKVDEKACYSVRNNHLEKIALFSEETNFYYKLMPTDDWPTVTLSSTPMHRRTLISPKRDVNFKIREISPVKGRVLDACCGLGYTAILASKDADEVYTFEIDKNILYMAHLNPYSQELFSSKNIKLFEGDVFEGIKRFKDYFFDRIIHDPPTFKYCPELYSKKFYSELYRVMKKNGILYHYAPWPHITKNKVFYKGIIRRLKECGFSNVTYKQESSGIRALKRVG